MLKQLRGHLAKIPVLPELKALQKEKINEIHAHLLIATASFEQLIQTTESQEGSHVALGFRSIFIHCHFALEQMLSLKILSGNSKVTTTHDLTQLAEEAKIGKSEDRDKFLKEIAMHLWFCYPEDYRFFYAKKSYPQPFILLEKLLQKSDVNLLKEAIQLCFEKYSQTIELLTEVSSFSSVLSKEFLKKIKEVQKQVSNRITCKKRRKRHENQTGTIEKCQQALDILSSLDTLQVLSGIESKMPLNTIKEYLKLMKISFTLPQKSNTHSLQKFLYIETLSNIDKLFKHLFRAIILLQTGEDNHSHNLLELLQLVKNFYPDELITKKDKSRLQEINLSITHHYLYKESRALLKNSYKNVFNLACGLIFTENSFNAKYKKSLVSHKTLDTKIKELIDEVACCLELFIKLLQPVASELAEIDRCYRASSNLVF